ncbi:hypothetical protein CPB83DRAFT_848762 [Crepidotus variabilis]|uniref:Uncharacterized protein n=1 Tax=Crepidotus variabilis TaxID=179855 RepID=A0A9P6JTD0_9AGAR|nr:hypothetical protein CPB83DRAFT_848762 [Crepidotus variabilis]
MAESVVKYQAALSETRTINDDMHDTANTLWHQLDWEKLLIPGPSSIAILGKLTMVGLVDHIMLEQGNKPYEHLNNLDFRACVVKLRNEFINAFSASYINMEKMSKQCQFLLGTTHETISLVLEYDMEGMSLYQRNSKITLLLPDFLEQMASSVKKCDTYVAECVTGFQTALYTAQDLQTASTLTFGISEEKTKQLESKERELKTRVTGAEERKKIQETYLADARKSREQAEKRFDKTMDAIPKGGELLALQAGEKLVELGAQAGSMFIQKHMNLTNAAFAAGTDLAKQGAGVGFDKLREGDKPSTPGASGTTPPTAPAPPVEEIDFSDPAFSNADQLREILGVFKNVVTGGTGGSVNWNAVIASEDGENTSLGYVIAALDGLADDENAYGKFKDARDVKAIYIASRGHANKLKATKDRDSEEVKKIVTAVKSLALRADKVAASIALKSKRPAISASLTTSTPPPPVTQPTTPANAKSIVQATTENAQFGLAKAEAQLDASRECYAKANEAMLQLSKELNEFNVELAGINPQKIQWEKVRKVLGQAIGHLSQLVHYLTQLSEFFAYIRATVTELLRPQVDGFVKRAGTQLDDLKGMTFDSYAKKTFAKDCINIASITFVMRQIGTAYTAVYNSQIGKGMKLLSDLPIVPTGDQAGAMISSGKALEKWSLEAQDEMRTVLENNSKEFNKKLRAQKERLETLKSILPPPPEYMKEMVTAAKIEEVQAEVPKIQKRTLPKFDY